MFLRHVSFDEIVVGNVGMQPSHPWCVVVSCPAHFSHASIAAQEDAAAGQPAPQPVKKRKSSGTPSPKEKAWQWRFSATTTAGLILVS